MSRAYVTKQTEISNETNIRSVFIHHKNYRVAGDYLDSQNHRIFTLVHKVDPKTGQERPWEDNSERLEVRTLKMRTEPYFGVPLLPFSFYLPDFVAYEPTLAITLKPIAVTAKVETYPKEFNSESLDKALRALGLQTD